MKKDFTLKTLQEVEQKKREGREGLIGLLAIALISILVLLAVRYIVLFTGSKLFQKQTIWTDVEVSVIENKGFAVLENKPVGNLKK